MIARARLIAAALVLVALLAFLLVQWGAGNQRARDAANEARDYRTTTERIRDATDLDRSPDAVLDRLRRHAER